ncbi:MAG: hypothetical protein PGN16_06570 [Sphingomonas phyllosphaerae]|uniref:hypothetical protein n=1 Tax=Sphingomonas phyllosphaerae TaxID=257003 RepID=UPI002FF7BA96
MNAAAEAARIGSIVSRVLAGTVGAYALTSLVTALVSLLLAGIGLDRAEAVTAATLPSFAIFAIIAMTAFRVRRAARAWGWLIALAVPMVILLLLLHQGIKG